LPKIKLDEVLQISKTISGIIIRSKFKIDKKFIDTAVNLKIIGRVGAGLENIDTQYCKVKNIEVVNSPEGNRDAVGEHALGMILSLFNNLNKCNNQLKLGIWDREGNRGIELSGKTVGIIGYGNMGSAFAEKLSGFNVNVIAYDKYKFNYSNNFAKETNLDEIFEKTDVLSIHTPQTEETINMINSEFISKFRKNIYIVNTARGKIVNTNDLVSQLKTGKILGACLDVLEFEKLNFEEIFGNNSSQSFNYLVNSEKVLLSPHVAGWTNESYYKISKIIANKFTKILLGT
jgi:D-3-phosphoglycerate dehydrogenase